MYTYIQQCCCCYSSNTITYLDALEALILISASSWLASFLKMDLLLLPEQAVANCVLDNNKHVKVALCRDVVVLKDVEVDEETKKNLGSLNKNLM